MKVTYINHSGFLLEMEDAYFLFDYYKKEIPAMDPSKMIFVFSSHSHDDHFNPAVFALKEQYPHVQFIFSKEVRHKVRHMEKKGELTAPEILYIPNLQDAEVQDLKGNTVNIHALRSTDLGCGFYLEYQGKAIYHAGDLHWWSWPGEPEADNRNMIARYKQEMEYLRGKTLDIAFNPLDGRQEGDYADGINYLLSIAKITTLFPMHFWNDFSVIDRYLNEYSIPEGTDFVKLTHDGQLVEITK